jgi:hypothetical protein
MIFLIKPDGSIKRFNILFQLIHFLLLLLSFLAQLPDVFRTSVEHGSFANVTSFAVAGRN